MEMQKYGCMLKTSSFGVILLAYDIITHEGAQNEPNLPLCGGGTVLSLAVNVAKNWGGLGPFRTMKNWKFRSILMMIWHLEQGPGPPLTSRSI